MRIITVSRRRQPSSIGRASSSPKPAARSRTSPAGVGVKIRFSNSALTLGCLQSRHRTTPRNSSNDHNLQTRLRGYVGDVLRFLHTTTCHQARYVKLKGIVAANGGHAINEVL